MTSSEKLLNLKFKIGLLPTIDFATFFASHFPSTQAASKSIIHLTHKNNTVNYIDSNDYLTAKDIIIMQLVADGFTAMEIADKLGLSNRTVEHRILDLRKKLRCKS